MSIQKLGGGRTRDLGPSAAIHARGRVPGGVMVGQGISPLVKNTGLSMIKGQGGSIVTALRDTPEQAEARKQKAREAYEAFKAKHSDCECHELYGNQPRPRGYREREKDRWLLRRELGKR